MATLIGAPVITLLLLGIALRLFVPAALRSSMRRILNGPISETLAELFVSVQSNPPQDLLYLSLRAEHGGVIIRPMGSAKPVKGLDCLSLVPAQLARPPLGDDEPVDLSVTLGPRSGRPVVLDLPIYVSGMAYGLAMSREARLAFAKGSALSKTALATGQGPFFEDERALAYKYILQYGRWTWNRSDEVFSAADMIEVQVGQGAMPGNAVVGHVGELSGELRKMMGLDPGVPPTVHSRLFLDDPSHPTSLRRVVDHLRQRSPEVPVSIKFGAGDAIEDDLDVAVDAGVDIITIDGTEGATGNAPVTLSDDFGIPSLAAMARAQRHLQRRGRRGDVQVVLSGGLRGPGDFLKALALGADCCAIGTAAMIAVSHNQLGKALPFYPPTKLVFYDQHPRFTLDVDKGAEHLHNYFQSCAAEMRIALRTMGRRSVGELSLRDLSTTDQEVARICGCHWSGEAAGQREEDLAPVR